MSSFLDEKFYEECLDWNGCKKSSRRLNILMKIYHKYRFHQFFQKNLIIFNKYEILNIYAKSFHKGNNNFHTKIEKKFFFRYKRRNLKFFLFFSILNSPEVSMLKNKFTFEKKFDHTLTQTGLFAFTHFPHHWSKEF